MAYKALVINSNLPISDQQSIGEITFSKATFENLPTLHDFHIIIIDISDIFDKDFWEWSIKINPDSIRDKIREQIVTGGIVLCFCDVPVMWDQRFKFQLYHNLELQDMKNSAETQYLFNYFFCPIPLGIVNEKGDTFQYITENLKSFKLLMKKIPKEDIFWNCYFSRNEPIIKSLGVNRAGYSVFTEVTLGEGKLIMLPSFKNKIGAFFTIIQEIIPQMVKEDDLGQIVPKWATEIKLPIEDGLKLKLSEIRNAKNLISTNGKTLEKAVMSAFTLLGFRVEKMNIGSHSDIQIFDGDKTALVEVKGHKNRQGTRTEINQIFAHLAEIENSPKGIMVVNHEFDKPQKERSESAFTLDVIKLAERADISLISCSDLFEIIMKIVENQISDDNLKEIRNKILDQSGLIDLKTYN
jgi:hypothetical protein